jgi:hypothetical protein
MVLKTYGSVWVIGKAYGERGVSQETEWVVACRWCNTILVATTWQIRKRKVRCSCLKGTYSSWRNMEQRCTNAKHKEYGRYGGRGIVICDQWLDDFQQFVDDMGKRPEGKSIDRRDPNGNYTPENCYWATPWEQAQNRCNSVRNYKSPAVASVHPQVVENIREGELTVHP